MQFDFIGTSTLLLLSSPASCFCDPQAHTIPGTGIYLYAAYPTSPSLRPKAEYVIDSLALDQSFNMIPEVNTTGGEWRYDTMIFAISGLKQHKHTFEVHLEGDGDEGVENLFVVDRFEFTCVSFFLLVSSGLLESR